MKEHEGSTRVAIERAIDAYDDYRESGEHSGIFGGFRPESTFFVRSTQERAGRVYATKPIVGFVRGETGLNGGWGQKTYAAAWLHNEGFIIVDKNGDPEKPPDKEFLIRDAKRIRLCALNYYIEPARESGAGQVSIRASDLAEDMGLKNAFPSICRALGGEEMRQRARVPEPTHTEPNPSSSTVFTYQLATKEGRKTMISEPPVKMPPATNLILYGPPGTGKTYATALEAVKLCVEKDAAAPLLDDRNALMKKYRDLEREGRIEFVTFHQSFSYEDFVEGLRPTTETEPATDEQDDAVASGGFSLKAHAGVFKAISERARLDTGNATTKRLDRSRQIYKIALGRRGSQEDRIREGLDQSLIHTGWGGDIDWSDDRFDDLEEIRKEWNARAENEPEWRRCLSTLLSAFADGLFNGQRVTIQRLLTLAAADGRLDVEGVEGDAALHLAQVGVRIVQRPADGAHRDRYLAVANDPDCRGLNQLFVHTAWQNGVWRQSLERAPAALAGVRVRFNGRRGPQVRATLIPWDAVDGGDEDSNVSGYNFNIKTTFAFRSGIQIGDYVVISDGIDSFRAFGKVTGEYEFDPIASFHPHRRKVEWIWRGDNGAERAAFYLSNFGSLAAHRLEPDLVDWDALETVVIDADAERPVAGARPHVLIIDEINRANISKVFGELITLLEADKRLGCENEVRVRLPYSGRSFGVPSNLHIIGTMNTADRSIALLDTALRRRFAFRELMPDISELRNAMDARELDVENLDGVNLSKLLTTINERIEYLFDREHQIGHAYFTGCRDRVDVEEAMRHKIIPLLAEYFYEDWSKVAAVLGDSAGGAKARFLEATDLLPPADFGDDEHDGKKRRWSVKEKFDFSEFES